MQPVRTNSPIESYHSRLKRLAKKPHFNLYLLIELLYSESSMANFKFYMLANDKLVDNQKKYTSAFTFTLFSYWEKFNVGNYDSTNTLFDGPTNLISENYKYIFNCKIWCDMM